jgi:hypothetical protein
LQKCYCFLSIFLWHYRHIQFKKIHLNFTTCHSFNEYIFCHFYQKENCQVSLNNIKSDLPSPPPQLNLRAVEINFRYLATAMPCGYPKTVIGFCTTPEASSLFARQSYLNWHYTVHHAKSVPPPWLNKIGECSPWIEPCTVPYLLPCFWKTISENIHFLRAKSFPLSSKKVESVLYFRDSAFLPIHCSIYIKM